MIYHICPQDFVLLDCDHRDDKTKHITKTKVNIIVTMLLVPEPSLTLSAPNGHQGETALASAT